jgi:hypothetical protein
MPHRISVAIGNLRNLLTQKGKDVIQGFWDGLTFIWKKVTSFISGIAGWVKSHKGPLSLDRKLLEPAGRALMHGLSVGLTGGFVKIADLIGGIAGKIGGFFSHLIGGARAGVGQWMGIVLQALALNGLPASLAGQVLYQISTESGGNPNAINLSDINAQHGDPSRGLLQTIGSTFAAYHVAGTSRNIYDPLANVAAAINYAKHVYGPGLMRGSSGLGSGHGYAFGTASASPGWAMVGERGPEMVRFRGGERVIPHNRLGGGNTYLVTVNVNGALSTEREIQRAVVDGITNFERHGGNVPWVSK